MNQAFKILVCGSRDWTDTEEVFGILRAVANRHAGKRLILVHGGQGQWFQNIDPDKGKCPQGADLVADTVGKRLGFEIRTYPADWYQNGKLDRSQGPKRNQKMLDCEHPDKEGVRIGAVYAFHDVRFFKSKTGTGDMVSRACGAGIPVRIVVEPVPFLQRKEVFYVIGRESKSHLKSRGSSDRRGCGCVSRDCQ
jgi:hypothetical protein